MIRAALAMLLVALTAPSFAQGASCPAPSAPLRPIVKTHVLPPYPPLSVQMNESGTTLLEVLIGTDGKVISDRVVTSSGSARLDEAAADFVKETWLWEAPKLECKPVQVATRISIKWDLRDARGGAAAIRLPVLTAAKADYPPDALKRLERGDSIVAFYIGADGTVEAQMNTVRSSGFPDLDDAATGVIRAHRWGAVMLDGKPTGTPMVAIVKWEPDGAPPPPK